MTLPQGFRIGTAAAGFRKAKRDDVAVIVSNTSCAVAGVFTTNAFKAAPVLECQRILQKGDAIHAVLVNSGQANACTGDTGMQNCRKTKSMVGVALGIAEDAILPLSTGVIGEQLKMDLWEERAVPMLAASLGSKDEEAFTRAMMTTDAFPKFASRHVILHNGTISLTGMAKGAGMICPNMATMLAVVLCDVCIDTSVWQELFVRAVDKTFNRVTVDGDTSTNDTVLGLANGCSQVTVTAQDMALLEKHVEEILGQLAYMLVQDGEGSTKVIHIEVCHAKSQDEAEKVARTVGHSQLVKTAMYGRDANWGRIVAAVGRSGADFIPEAVRVTLCGVELFCNGQPTGANEEALTAKLKERDIYISIDLGCGEATYTLLASDLSHDYVSCNADYRT